MRVRILNGNQAGSIVDVGPEGAIMLSNGLAEVVSELAPADVVAAPEPAIAAEDDPAASGASLTDEDTNDSTTETPEPEPVPARVRRRSAKPKADPATSRRKRR